MVDEAIATYEIIKNLLIHELYDKVNESNHRQFFSPLRKYIIFLLRNERFKETLSVLDNLIVLEMKYYGKFHMNLAKSLETKGKIYGRLFEPKRALSCYEQALKICTEMNEKELAAKIQLTMNELANRN